MRKANEESYINIITSSDRSIKIEKDSVEMNKKDMWEKQSDSYNTIFDYLKSKGLNESELIDFSQLLFEYIHFI